MIYALKSALLLTLLYGGFATLLSRETFHRFNRTVLLGIVVLSLVLPAVRVTTSSPSPLALQQYWPADDMAHESYEPSESHRAYRPHRTHEPHEKTLTPPTAKHFWEALYIIGVAIALIRFMRRSLLLARSLRGGLRSCDGLGNTIIVRGGHFPPFSFMHWIVLSLSDYEHHRRAILTHEQAHARLGHSWDVLLLEVVQIVQWFNPFAWLLGRELKAIHEYEADEAVICQGIDATQYQQLLVIKAVGNRLQLFARSTLVACFCKNTLNRGSLKQRINMMQQKKSNPWRMLRVAFAIPVAALALVAFATPETRPQPLPNGREAWQGQEDTERPSRSEGDGGELVEYKAHQKWGKGYRDYYLVHLPEGVWVEGNGASHIEEQFFSYSFDNTKRTTVMQLNGKPFDQNSLPTVSSSELKKIEIKKMEKVSAENGGALNMQGAEQVVNLITTPVTIPADVEGNVPRVQTLLLPGKGELYIKNGKATPGDWMHSSVTSWEKTSYNYSVRNEFEKSKTKPGFKCWIYASTETAEKDITRAEALMRELGITNYEVVRNLPKRHFTDSELRQWAQAQKAKGTPFNRLFDAMAPNHMDCADVHRQWHIVKAVYGRK